MVKRTVLSISPPPMVTLDFDVDASHLSESNSSPDQFAINLTV